MSYLVIARKWRPQTFDEVVGQPHVARTLKNAILLQRIAHAYLFTGARGVGKTSVARIFAKSLNCMEGASPTPCNVCANCTEITQGNSMDVLEIDGASNRGIDNIRELRETVRYRPAKSRYKIYIIDEVHMLTAEAFNALLKTLEEPPEHVLFIFATTEPHKIPATILSRCQRFDFRRIPTGLLVEHLKRIAGEEKSSLSENVLYAVAREAEGSMRDAQSLLEQLLAFSGQEMPDEEILDVLGVVDRRSVHEAAGAILDGNARDCLSLVDNLYRRGIDSRRFCQQLAEHFRNLLLASLGGTSADEASALDLPETELEVLKAQAGKSNPETLQVYFQLALAAQDEIRRTSAPKLALEMLLIRLSRIPRMESLDLLLEKVGGIEKRLSAGEAFGAAERPAAYSAGPAPGAGYAGYAGGAARKEPAPEPRPAGGGGDFGRRPGEPRRESRSGDAPVKSPGPAASAAPLAESAVAAIGERWGDFIHWLDARDPILAAKLKRSRVAGTQGNLVEFEVLEIYEDAFKEERARKALSDAAAAFFGGRVDFLARVRSSNPPGGEKAKAPGKSKSDVQRTVMEHPAVTDAMEILGGELVEIRRLKSDKHERNG